MSASTPNPDLTHAYALASQTYTLRNPTSHSLHLTALNHLPGGNTRTTLHYAPFPLSITSAHAATLLSTDQHSYTDFLGEYTAGLYGHSHPLITRTLERTIDRGLSFGSQHEGEVLLARAVTTRFASIDLVRFTNSGTEATLMALAAAKVYTRKNKILVFGGAYHGGAFSFKEGVSGPVNAPHEYLIARYNSLESVRELVEREENADDLAAITVEPMIGSGGAIPASHEFLRSLRGIANSRGAVLIFDEVMTSRMYDGSGVQGILPEASRPDLTILGKWIGGGMSFGAFGGRREIMEMFDPRKGPSSLAHAGTFNNNVLTMAAGRVGLEEIFTPARARELHERGERLIGELREVAVGTLMRWTGLGSIMNVTFTTTPVEEIRCSEDFGEPVKELGDLLHLFLLEQGYYIARRGFVSLSLALTNEDLAGFVDAVREFVEEHKDLLVQT
jgi:glutamate-1-semialdehyde 2,1-aminomutase